MMNNLLTEVKQIAKDMVDPRKKVDGKTAKMKVDPIKKKLEILDKYVESLSTILPDAGFLDEGTWGVTALNTTLDKHMSEAQTGHDELRSLLEEISVWENHQKKDPEDVKTGVASGEGGSVKASEIKGVATSLKPEELTSQLAAYDMSLWIEQWDEFKNNSVFGNIVRNR